MIEPQDEQKVIEQNRAVMRRLVELGTVFFSAVDDPTDWDYSPEPEFDAPVIVEVKP